MSAKGAAYFDRRTETNNDDSDDDSPRQNEASDVFGGIVDTMEAVGRAIDAHPTDETQWTQDTLAEKSEQVRWYAALHEVRKTVGKIQGNDNPFTMDEYRDEFPELPGLEAKAPPEEFIDLLESAGGDTEGMSELRIPVVDGEALPLLVGGEGELNDALVLLSELPDDPEPAEASEPDTDVLQVAADEGTVVMADIEAAIETWGNPADGVTVGDIRDWCGKKGNRRLTDLTEAQALLEVERAGDGRTTAITALESRINAIKSSAASEESDAESDGGYFDGDDEEDEPTEETVGDDPVGFNIDVDLPDDASKGQRLKTAGGLMDMGVPEDEAMRMVGL